MQNTLIKEIAMSAYAILKNIAFEFESWQSHFSYYFILFLNFAPKPAVYTDLRLE